MRVTMMSWTVVVSFGDSRGDVSGRAVYWTLAPYLGSTWACREYYGLKEEGKLNRCMVLSIYPGMEIST